MTPEDRERERLQSMPGKTIGGLTVVWVVSALVLVNNFTALIAAAGNPWPMRISQVFAHAFILLVFFALGVLAFAVALRQRWARTALIAIAVLGGAASLVLMVFDNPLYGFWLAYCVTVVVLLGSHQTEEWCDQ